jgi:hypothetical protein
MKNIKHIRENYNNVIEEQENAETDRLTKLIRAGLFDVKKLSFLKRALKKDINKLTPADRKVLMELLETLIDEVVNSPNVYSKVRQNVMTKEELEITEANKKDDYLVKLDPRFSKSPKVLPAIIILKRKAMRVYPDNQVIGLYYSQVLDRYVSIPFETNEKTFNVGLSEAVSPTVDDDSEDKKKTNKKTPQDIRNEIRRKAQERLMTTRMSDLRSSERSVARKLAAKEAIKSAMSGDKYKALGIAGGLIGSLFSRKNKSTTTNVASKPTEQPSTTPSGVSMSRGAAVAKDLASNPVKTTTTATPPSGVSMSRGAAVAKNLTAEPPKPSPIPDNLVKGRGGRAKGAPLSDTQNAIRKRTTRAVASAARNTAAKGMVAENKIDVKQRFAQKLEEKRTLEENPLGLAIAAGRVAAPVIARGAVAVGRAVGRGAAAAGRAVGRGAANLAGAALGSNLNNDDRSPATTTPEEPPKYLSTAIDKKLEAKVSKPENRVDTRAGGEARRTQDTSLNRKYMQATNEDVINNLRSIVEEHQNRAELNINGKQIVINNTIAEKVITAYDSLNRENKIKMISMLNESPETFKKVVNFAVRQ